VGRRGAGGGQSGAGEETHLPSSAMRSSVCFPATLASAALTSWAMLLLPQMYTWHRGWLSSGSSSFD
jgi:hypothetical protein